MMKDRIDNNFEAHYGFHSGANINCESTREKEFDLTDKNTASHIVTFGDGEASFLNSNTNEIEVLAFDDFITRVNRDYKALRGKSICDFIVEDKTSSTIILFEYVRISHDYSFKIN